MNPGIPNVPVKNAVSAFKGIAILKCTPTTLKKYKTKVPIINRLMSQPIAFI